MTVDLDSTPAPEPFVPDWCTVGARVCIISGGRYGNPDSVREGTIKTIGKRDVIVSIPYGGDRTDSYLERWRHDNYTPQDKALGGPADTYSRYHSEGRMGGYRLTLAAFDNPALVRVRLVSDVEDRHRRVRSLMHKYSTGSIEENATLAYHLGLHTGALQALDKYDAEKAADK